MLSQASGSSSLTAYRQLRTVIPPTFSALQTYNAGPSSDPDLLALSRPPRPSEPTFFTGRPSYFTALSDLQTALHSAQQSLRKSYIFPLPTTLAPPQPPRASWLSAPSLTNLLGTKLKTSNHRRVIDLLNELHQLRYIAELSDKGDVVEDLNDILKRYERSERRGNPSASSSLMSSSSVGEERRKGIDEYGRGYGMGRRKESSARVWIIPSKAYSSSLNTQSVNTENGGGLAADSDVESLEGIGEVLINHSPLSTYFPKLSDRETVLRSFKISGLLGAFNVFALTRGGGSSGQAGAVGLGIARALAIMREDVKDVLIRDGALMRDTRMVERKKTGNEKARKKYAWVKR